MIKLEHLKKTYNPNKSNEIKVVNDTSIELPSIGLISFLGASGSGKTTLLNIIGGLDKSDSGTITYDDLTFNKYNMREIDKFRSKNIGYVFQNYNLLNDKTVYDNLKIALEIVGITDEEEISKRIEYTLKAVGLYKYRKKLASALSGGQQQRVSIARCLIKNSKIIIADEPTGNLDSENSLEIMNILKKISEKTLVLLVTHDENLANAYSDKIVKIKDGLLTEVISLESNPMLKNNSDNKIYLKDLNEVKEGEVVKTHYYQSDKFDTLELTIVEKNGIYYIESNKKIKLLKDSQIRLIDSHYEEEIKVNMSDFEYDTTWYNDNIKTNKSKSIFRSFVNELKSFFITRKKTKFFHLVFFLLGIIIGIINILYIDLTYVDTSFFSTENDSIYTKDRIDSSDLDILIKAKDDGIIESVKQDSYTQLSLTYYQTSFETLYRSVYGRHLYDTSLLEGYSLLAGRDSKSPEELIIGKDLADEFCEAFGGISYETLLTLNTNSYNTLVGISSKQTSEIYANRNNTVRMVLQINEYVSSRSHLAGVYSYEKHSYDITSGEDLDGKTNSVIINEDNSTNTTYSIGQIYNNSTIVGFYTFKDGYDSKVDAIYSDDLRDNIVIKDNIYINSLDTIPDYEIVEGRKPESKYEIMINAYNDYEVGRTIKYSNITYTIVGKFNYANNDSSLVTFTSYAINDTFDYIYINEMANTTMNMMLKVSDREAFDDLMSTIGLEFKTVYDYEYEDAIEESNVAQFVLMPIIGVLIVAVIVYIYFSMRSKMISEIYDIGVYRALGSTRSELIGRQLISIVVLSTFTSFIGYLLCSGIYGGIASAVQSLGGNMTSVWDQSSTYIIGLILYLVSILFGIIPIATLTRKTPSEIISKYDI